MGKPEEEQLAEGADEGIDNAVDWRSNYAVLLRSHREYSADGKGKLIAALALQLVGLTLPFIFVFAAALIADKAVGAPGGGLVGWAAHHQANQLVVFLALAALLITAAAYFERAWIAQAGDKAAAAIGKKLFSHLISLPLDFFAGIPISEVSDAVIADVERVRSAWAEELRLGLKYSLLALVAIILMIVVLPGLAAVVVGIPLAIGLGWWIFIRVRARRIPIPPVRPNTEGASATLRETVASLSAVKAFANENYQRGRFRHHVDREFAEAMRAAGQHSGLLGILSLILVGLTLYVWWFAAASIEADRLEAGRFVAFVILLIITGVALLRAVQLVLRLNAAAAAAQRMQLLVAEPAEALETGVYLPGSRDRLEGHVKVKNLTFTGADDLEKPIIDSLSFALSVGERIAIVGPSGSGKSKLSSLILGIESPQSGTIHIDERPLDDYPLAWVRSQIGWVPQQASMMTGTVAHNIAYGRPGASREEIREAAEKAGALGFIDALPNGFETQLRSDFVDTELSSDRVHGIRLPDRDQRRIAIARVFLEDPPIVFIDAPSSSLSTGTGDAEEALMTGRTAIVVATGMSATRAAGEIIVMRGGKVAERGSHDDLYADKGYYRMLCESDFGKS